jgi:hypothetical protein
MKRKIVDKGISAAGTILFVGLIQTDAPAWSLIILALFLYEMALWCCQIARKEARRQRKQKYIVVRNKDAERWWNTRFVWPMKEVS